MGTEERIFDYQLRHGVFDNANHSAPEGIAKLAVDKGFNTLSPAQKSVMNNYLSQRCSGVTDPGGHHNECSAILSDEALLQAYERCDDTDSLVCESCYNEEAEYARQWDKISQE